MRFIPIAAAICLAQPALAADWYTGARPTQPADDWVVSVDASADVTSQGSSFADVQVTGAPAGALDQSGVRLRAEGLGGRYSYYSTTDARTIDGTQLSGAFLAGYQWVSPSFAVSAYLGADIRDNTLSVVDPGNPVVGTSVGGAAQFELFATPTRRTMVDVAASYETNATAYFVRLRGGYLVAPGLYVGPEVLALGDAFFAQQRLGAHLTGLRLGPTRLSLAAGYLYDRVRKAGAYSTISASVDF
jgi:Cellulose biosynthesis protein BcsS